MPRPANEKVHVVIATPLGQEGKGGVDRIMDVVRSYDQAQPDPDVSLRFVTTRGPGSILLSPFYLFAALLRFGWLRLRRRADVLHVNLGQGGSALRKLVLCGWARLMGAPYVLHLHGSEFHHFWDSAHPVTSARLRDLFEAAASVVVLGEPWRRYVSGKAPRARIEVVPNATYAPKGAGGQPSRPGAPVHILFLGEMGPRKGVPELIDALQALDTRQPWRATLAGNGAVAQTRSEIERLNLAHKVRVTGWVGPAEVEALLTDADVLVLPSHHENLPMSVIEAMAYGLAVVTTPVGAVEDVIEPEVTGLLCPPGDAARLAEAIRRVVEDASLRAKLGQAAKTFHRARLDVEPYVAKLRAIWVDAARRRRVLCTTRTT